MKILSSLADFQYDSTMILDNGLLFRVHPAYFRDVVLVSVVCRALYHIASVSSTQRLISGVAVVALKGDSESLSLSLSLSLTD